jgi:hypothetical protein
MGGAIRIAGAVVDVERYLDDPALLEQSLAEVRRASGHALCECSIPPRRLVVRRLGTRHILAVWPDDGANHAFACPFYRDERGESAERPLGGEPAAAPEDESSLQVDFAFARQAGIARRAGVTPATVGSSSQPTTGTTEAVHSPASLLSFIWARARLNCWAATWTRDWWRVRREVYRVAQETRIGSAYLDELLFVPLPFRNDAERRQAIDSEWQHLVEDLAPRDGQVPRRLVLAEVKALSKSEYGYKLELRNMPWPIYLNREQWNLLQACYARALMSLNSSSEPQIRLVALLLVEAAANGKHYFSLCDSAMLMTSAQWIPCHTTAELRLATELADRGRAFTWPMGADDTAPATPDFWLHDTGDERPCALEVLGVDAVPYRERKMRRVTAIRSAGHAAWVWDATRESVIDLPQPEQAAKRTGQ